MRARVRGIGGCGHDQHVGGMALGGQGGALGHTEAVLLVGDGQGQVGQGPQGHDLNVPLPLSDQPQDGVHRVGALGLHLRGAKTGLVPHPVFAVDPLGAAQRAAEGVVRPG